jgi:hypothetical protein
MSGFITLHRSLLDWEWYSDINTKTLFIHCLLKANWEDKNWQGIDIKRGSFITSNQNLSAETKLTIQQIRTSIFKLTKTNEINIQTTNKYTLLTIVKYDFYQTLENKATNKQQTNNTQNNKQITTTNNIINKQLDILNNSLLSEIKISDDKKFFLVNNIQIETTPEKITYFKTAVEFQKLFIKNLKEKNSTYSLQEKAKYKNYVDPIRLMIENKEATLNQLRDAYKYLNSPEGEFWKSNILSISKLREQISVLLAKKNTLATTNKKQDVFIPDPNKRKQF